MNAVMDALAAHAAMSKQALDSERVREGIKDVLLGPAQLYEALRERGTDEQRPQSKPAAVSMVSRRRGAMRNAVVNAATTCSPASEAC
jgi:hypothetical protein